MSTTFPHFRHSVVEVWPGNTHNFKILRILIHESNTTKRFTTHYKLRANCQKRQTSLIARQMLTKANHKNKGCQ